MSLEELTKEAAAPRNLAGQQAAEVGCELIQRTVLDQ